MTRQKKTRDALDAPLWVKIVGGIVAGIFVLGLLTAGLISDGFSALWNFIGDLGTFFLQALIVMLMALALVVLVQWLRNQSFTDRDGAAQEMAIVRSRIGTANEEPGDQTAVAIQYVGTTIFLAVVILSYFMFHSP